MTDNTKAKTGRLSMDIPGDLLERARGAADALGGAPLRLRLVDIVTAGMRHEVERLERAHNSGKPFPAPERLRGGGRVG